MFYSESDSKTNIRTNNKLKDCVNKLECEKEESDINEHSPCACCSEKNTKKTKADVTTSNLKRADDPFKDMKISSPECLNVLDERSYCPKCSKSRKYFCYTCYIPVSGLEGKIPKINLPISVDIIKHRQETDGKSTATHAVVLAPAHVSIYTYPCFPDYEDTGEVVLVFPSPNAKVLEDYASEIGSRCRETDDTMEPAQKKSRLVPSFQKVLFIDCTWNQTKKIICDERIRNLPTLQLKSYDTVFWRLQHGNPSTFLSTIEAIYYFMVDYHRLFVSSDYQGQYDDLLFFFSFLYEKIHEINNSSSVPLEKVVLHGQSQIAVLQRQLGKTVSQEQIE